jgi:hypothetical protein
VNRGTPCGEEDDKRDAVPVPGVEDHFQDFRSPLEVPDGGTGPPEVASSGPRRIVLRVCADLLEEVRGKPQKPTGTVREDLQT